MTNIRVKTEEHVAVITLDRPPVNALSIGLLNELNDVLTELEQNEKVRVLLIHGNGRFFAAGADIKEFTEVKDGTEFADIARKGQRLFDRMERFPKPMIAVVHGAALGGGLELAMSCHIRLTTEDAKLGLPELQLGLIPGFAGTQRLPRYVGKAKAAEMMLTSEPITGKEAKKLRLVNSIYEEEKLMENAIALAKKIAQKSTVSVKMILELLKYSDEPSFSRGVEREAELFGQVYDSEDGQEGIQAFLEKRPPHFKNR